MTTSFKNWTHKQGFSLDELSGPLHELEDCWHPVIQANNKSKQEKINQLRTDLAEANMRYADLKRINRQRLAEREAECLKLRESVNAILNGNPKKSHPQIMRDAREALSTPPSTSYLEQWEKERYGEPVAKVVRNTSGQISLFNMEGDGFDIYKHIGKTLYARKD